MTVQFVRDLMVPIDEYPKISINATVDEAVRVLKKNFKKEAHNVVCGHKTLIVQDYDDKTVGVVTLRSLLKAVAVEEKSKNKFTAAIGFNSRKKKMSGLLVKDIMRSRDIAHVYEHQPIAQAVQLMVDKQVNSLLVIEKPEASELTYGEYPLENHRAVGIIRSIDVFEVIGDFLDLDYKVITLPHLARYSLANKG